MFMYVKIHHDDDKHIYLHFKMKSNHNTMAKTGRCPKDSFFNRFKCGKTKTLVLLAGRKFLTMFLSICLLQQRSRCLLNIHK